MPEPIPADVHADCEIQKISRAGICFQPATRWFAGIAICDDPAHTAFARGWEAFSEAVERGRR